MAVWLPPARCSSILPKGITLYFRESSGIIALTERALRSAAGAPLALPSLSSLRGALSEEEKQPSQPGRIAWARPC